jgi:MFS family permease
MMPSYETFAVALIPVGLSSLTLMTAANATVQMTTDPEMRGRVMSLYMAIFMGGTPIGAPIIGWVGEEFGARWTIAVGGLISLLAALGAIAYLLRDRRVEVSFRRNQRPHVLVQVVPTDVEEREKVRSQLAAREAEETASAA